MGIYKVQMGSQPTYEELKHIPVSKLAVAALSSQPTYEELKHDEFRAYRYVVDCSQPTYEELKHIVLPAKPGQAEFSAYL